MNHHPHSATVVGILPGKCLLRAASGEDVTAPSKEGVVVGDTVTLNAGGSVEGIEPRRTIIARQRRDSTRRHGQPEEQVLAANLDIAVIVASAASPAFRPRLIDRLLIVCKGGGVTPLLCVTKADLAAGGLLPDLSPYEELGVATCVISSVTGEGIEELKSILRGKVSALVGPSGVGKSSLANVLFGSNVARTGETGEKTGRGRHTTTSGAMYEWEAGSSVIDTPGIRSLGVENIAKEDMQWYFPEFEAFRPHCKFSDCLHLAEPGCAVHAAADSGALNRRRYESYVKLASEA